MQSLLDHPLVGHLLTVGGFVLALFAIARIISEKRQPSNTLAWLLAIILIPYVGVPLYLVLGGRKLRRLLARKLPFRPTLPGPANATGAPPSSAVASPTAQTAIAGGASPPVGGNSLRLLTNGEDAYRALDLSRLRQEMKAPVVIDLRNIYNPEEMAAKGFRYTSIGRPGAR